MQNTHAHATQAGLELVIAQVMWTHSLMVVIFQTVQASLTVMVKVSVMIHCSPQSVGIAMLAGWERPVRTSVMQYMDSRHQ